MRIDAHQHVWTLGAHGCEWPTPELTVIYRDYALSDLEALARPLGVSGSVLVQSQPKDEDTDWLLDQAAVSPFVLAVVGWADLKAADAPRRIAELAGRAKLRGLRPMLQALPDDWIADPALDPAVAAMVEAGLSLDALVFTRHLPHLEAFARRWPELPIVIDHGAKPPIAAAPFDAAWAEGVERLAALPQVFCKLSGLATEGREGQAEADFGPWARHLVRCFGDGRLMWGSDWPVIELRMAYRDWLAMAERLSGLGGAALESLRAGAAMRFYRL